MPEQEALNYLETELQSRFRDSMTAESFFETTVRIPDDADQRSVLMPIT